MQTYINRLLSQKVLEMLNIFPVVAILGPRQCGKSTLAEKIVSSLGKFLILDLEKTQDLNKLTHLEHFFATVPPDTIVCFDEIQRKPELFTTLRWVIDENRRNGRFLILGSASMELLRQSSESLAGRIGYLDLTPFLVKELQCSKYDLYSHWIRGGFPNSYLNKSEEASLIWRDNFILTFLERDIPQFGFNISALGLRQLWTMLAHLNGQTINYAKVAESLGVSAVTVKRHIQMLEQTYMIRQLSAYSANTKKRLIKSPKVYIRDSGILHSLLGIENIRELLSHPGAGASWESFALENILNSISPRWKNSFYRSSSGLEIDLVLEKGLKKLAVEFKVSKAPKLSKGFYYALKDLKISQALIVAPVDSKYQLSSNIEIMPISDAVDFINQY